MVRLSLAHAVTQLKSRIAGRLQKHQSVIQVPSPSRNTKHGSR